MAALAVFCIVLCSFLCCIFLSILVDWVEKDTHSAMTKRSRILEQLSLLDKACKGAAQRSDSKFLASILKKTVRSVKSGLGATAQHATVWKARRASDLRQQAVDSRLQRTVQGLAGALSNDLLDEWDETLAGHLAKSSLLSFITQELESVSFGDTCRRVEFYSAIIDLISAMCQPGVAELLFCSLPGKHCTIFSAVEALKKQAQSFSKVAPRPQPPPVSNSAGPRCSCFLLRWCKHASQNRLHSDSELARRYVSLAERLEGLAKDRLRSWETVDGVMTSSGSDSVDPNDDSGFAGSTLEMSEASYCGVLKELQVDFVPHLATRISFSHEKEFEGEVPSTAKRMKALSREIASLEAVLPLAPAASIFVRLDEEKAVLWQALITGPEGTPYADGCFLFDLYFPPMYPAIPPMVKFTTTGGGIMRFNPNLYPHGKVCLSLLGTWFGSPNEKWTSGVSTALQVLVSIQALILVPDPFFNEPGYKEGMAGGIALSRGYNQNVQVGTIKHSMIEYLKHPPSGFENVVKAHFKCKRDKILERVEQWRANFPAIRQREMDAACRELKDLLLKL